MSKSIQVRLKSEEKLADLDVWEIFKGAAIKDDLGLAKSAIAVLDAVKLTGPILFAHSKKSRERFEGIPTRYSYNLLLARYVSKSLYDCHENSIKAWVERDSKSIAAHFALNYQKTE